jgi:hypothetical protein
MQLQIVGISTRIRNIKSSSFWRKRTDGGCLKTKYVKCCGSTKEEKRIEKCYIKRRPIIFNLHLILLRVFNKVELDEWNMYYECPEMINERILVQGKRLLDRPWCRYRIIPK